MGDGMFYPEFEDKNIFVNQQIFALPTSGRACNILLTELQLFLQCTNFKILKIL